MNDFVSINCRNGEKHPRNKLTEPSRNAAIMSMKAKIMEGAPLMLLTLPRSSVVGTEAPQIRPRHTPDPQGFYMHMMAWFSDGTKQW